MSDRCMIIDNKGIIFEGYEDEITKVFDAIISNEETDWDCEWEGDLILVKELRRHK